MGGERRERRVEGGRKKETSKGREEERREEGRREGRRGQGKERGEGRGYKLEGGMQRGGGGEKERDKCWKRGRIQIQGYLPKPPKQ